MRLVAGMLLLVGCGGVKEVAAVSASARLLGAADGRVYWAEGSALHWLGPGMDEPVGVHDYPGADWATRGNFAAVGASFHFSHHNKLDAARPAGGQKALVETVTMPAGQHPSGAAVDGECVYVAEGDVDCHGRGAILGLPRWRHEPPGCARREAPVNGLQTLEFRLDGQFFYWIQGSCSERFAPRGGDVVALPRQVGPAIVIGPGEKQAQDLWVGDAGAYWRAAQGIRHVEKAPFRPPATLVEGTVTGLLVAGRSVFFTRKDGVYWLAHGKREPERLAAESDARDLVADDRFLYWIRPDAAQIVRRKRPD